MQDKLVQSLASCLAPQMNATIYQTRIKLILLVIVVKHIHTLRLCIITKHISAVNFLSFRVLFANMRLSSKEILKNIWVYSTKNSILLCKTLGIDIHKCIGNIKTSLSYYFIIVVFIVQDGYLISFNILKLIYS